MSRFLRVAGATAVVAASVAATSAPAWADISPSAPSTGVEIVGAYGGGNNTGPTAAFPYDFIELFNSGTTPQSLSGLSLQYVGATGYGGSSAGNWTSALPAKTLQPGQYFLWTGYGGTSNSPTLAGQEPTGDATDNSATVDMERYTFSLYLVNGTTPVYASTSVGAAVSVPAGDTVIDEFGVGPSTASGTPRFADTAPLGNPSAGVTSGGGLSNVTAALRTNVCTDTGDNATDYQVVTPSANSPYPFKTTASAATPCTPPAATPESPLTIALPSAGAAVLGGAFLISRRRRQDRRSAAS